MPGPVSDSYDPEFGTGENAARVREKIQEIVDLIGDELGPGLHQILDVVWDGVDDGIDDQPPKPRYQDIHAFPLTEQQLRVVRFGLLRAMETI